MSLILAGLVLNFSIFYYENPTSLDRACRLPKQAFDYAVARLDSLSEESDNDSAPTMQLLRDDPTIYLAW